MGHLHMSWGIRLNGNLCFPKGIRSEVRGRVRRVLARGRSRAFDAQLSEAPKVPTLQLCAAHAAMRRAWKLFCLTGPFDRIKHLYAGVIMVSG